MSAPALHTPPLPDLIAATFPRLTEPEREQLHRDLAAKIATRTGKDPQPWVHGSTGTRTTAPGRGDGPAGGYTYLPRIGYTDYPDRYISTRWPMIQQHHCLQ